jgi:DNA polymerase bacteriophage-type
VTPWSIDFETRSGADIKLGLPAYLADREFDPLCMAFASTPQHVGLWTPDHPGEVSPLLDHVEAGGQVRAWNAAFEWYVWNHHCVPAYGWPPLKWEQLIDTMAEAAAMNLPQALGRCAMALGLPADQQKDKRGSQLIRLLCVPQEEPEIKPRAAYKADAAYKGAVTRHATWRAKGGRWLSDTTLLQELYAYCKQDVVSEMSIARKLRPLSAYEQRVWVKTQEINQRGVPIAVDEISNILSVVQAERERLEDELCDLTGGAVQTANERDKLLDWANAHLDEWDWLPDLQAKTLEDFVLRAEKDPHMDPPPWVVRAMQIRVAAGQASVGKYASMLKAVDHTDNRVRNMIVYHGASTGRDASRGGINLQNLVRPAIPNGEIRLAHDVLGAADHDLARLLWGDQVMDACAACVRGVIKAPPGYEFTDADFSSVENRVGVWLADQHDKLEMFRAGYDEYKVFSSTALHLVPYDQVTKDQRQMSKSAVLGCLFGQGWRGLIEYAKGFGVLLTEARAQEIVGLYREQYHKVKALWYASGDASLDAMANPGQWVPAGRMYALCYWRNFLWLRLPSGRLIAWASPKVEVLPTPWGAIRPVVTVMQVDSVTHQWCRSKLIGSSIFQSAVQAIARDLLMNGVFNVEDAGYLVVLRVHDELLSCNPIGFGSPDEFGSLMCKAPPWAQTLPLAYEAWRGDRLRK